MKKAIFTIAMILGLFSVVLSSCKKDDAPADTNPINTEASATYKLVMDGNIVAEGTSTNKVMMFGTTINLGGAGSDFVITITNVPESIGGIIAINESSGVNGDKCQLTISGKNMMESGADEIYWGTSGTVTRTSETKISFEGICKADASGNIVYTFSGNIESDAFKVN